MINRLARPRLNEFYLLINSNYVFSAPTEMRPFFLAVVEETRSQVPRQACVPSRRPRFQVEYPLSHRVSYSDRSLLHLLSDHGRTH